MVSQASHSFEGRFGTGGIVHMQIQDSISHQFKIYLWRQVRNYYNNSCIKEAMQKCMETSIEIRREINDLTLR